MKKLLFIALLSLIALRIAGQIENVDSLLNVLGTQELTTDEQLELYDEICITYLYSDYTNLMKYAETGLLIAEKVKNKTMMSKFTEFKGQAYLLMGNYENAKFSFDIALTLAIESKNKQQEASLYVSISVFYYEMNLIEKALEYLFKALPLYEILSDFKRYTLVLSNIAGHYRNLGEIDHAITYLEKAKPIAEELNYHRAKLKIYYDFGAIYLDREEYDNALEYGLLSVESCRASRNNTHEAIALCLISQAYAHLKQYNDAENCLNELFRLAELLNDPYLFKMAWALKSDVYLIQKRYKESEYAAGIFWEMDSLSIEAIDIAKNIVIANIQLGNKDKSETFFFKFYNLKNQYSEKSFHESLSNMEVKYETEKKEIRIASLEKERLLHVWLGVVGGFLVIALVITLLLTIRNARKKRQLIASESLQEGEIGERSRIAKDLHDRLGGSLSAVKIGLKNEESLQVINDKIDACMKELREIINNVMPVSLQKFGLKGALEDFSVSFSNLHFHFFGEDNRINPNQEYAVYCCVRELVNNALKHSGATSINLQLIQSRKHVSLTVQDNGCGFDEKTIEKGYGLENIRNRITTCKGKLDILSTPDKGTETVIEIKV